MKKTLFFAASALIALASCTTSDETFEGAQEQDAQAQVPVEFGTYVGIQTATRADYAGGTITADNLTDVKFGVFAYYTEDTQWASSTTATPNFMYNQKVTYASSAWTYTPVKFWPNDFSSSKVDNKNPDDETNEAIGKDAKGYVSFFAYAPFAEASDYTSSSTIDTR